MRVIILRVSVTTFLILLCAFCLFSDSSSTHQVTKEDFNEAKRWKSFSELEKYRYVEGFVSGSSVTHHICMARWLDSSEWNDFPNVSDRFKEVSGIVFEVGLYDFNLLRDTVTYLYQDPTNAHININTMILLAKAKIEGKDFEARMKEARTSAEKNMQFWLEMLLKSNSKE